MRAKQTTFYDEAAPMAGPSFGGGIRFRALWRFAFDWIVGRMELQRQRRTLAALTSGELEDIGLTPAQARREASKPFWET